MAAQPHHHTTNGNEQHEQDAWLNGGQYRPYPEHDPYLTPKLGEQPHLQAARPTTPVPPRAPSSKSIPLERRALNANTQITIRDLCWRCNGTGHCDRPAIYCRHPKCGRMFSSMDLERHNRHNWRNTLPCGHSTDYQATDWMTINCPTCADSSEGPGYLPRTITFSELVGYLLRSPEFLNPLLDILEGVYPDLAGPHTAEQRAVIGAGFAQAFGQSEPSAPTPHLASSGPVISPHLPPVSPVSPVAPTATPTEF